MQRTIRITITLIFVALIAAAFSHDNACAEHAPAPEITREDSDKELILELNDCIQERFKEIDEKFGYRRIIRIGDTPHRFKPENAKESKIVSKLEKADLKAALYLAGRRVIKSNPDIARLQPGQFIKGPGLITAEDKEKESLPKAVDLLEQSRRAIVEFEKADSYDFTLAGWKFTALPVRASEESCLMCHKSDNYVSFAVPTGDQTPVKLKIGDVLGVVIYAYGHSR
jgi:hypothetical protein